VKAMRLKAPLVGHVFRNCLICGKTFRVWRSTLTYRTGDFCTVECYRLGRKVFSKLLKDGRFEAMLRQMIDEERKKAA
jgi:hypothetical protein